MKTIEEIFDNVTLIGQTPNLILKAQLPELIFDEVKSWIEPCRKIKDNEYRELLNHRNVGTNHNSYQTAIPRRFIDNSFFFGYAIHFGELYLETVNSYNKNPEGNYNRRIAMRGYSGHYDGYDIWMNFTYKGDDNPMHNHAGSLSSIIYVKDEDCQPTIFPTINYTHNPVEGEILLFSSQLLHMVNTKETDSERISVSFNLEAIDHNTRPY